MIDKISVPYYGILESKKITFWEKDSDLGKNSINLGKLIFETVQHFWNTAILNPANTLNKKLLFQKEFLI